MDVNEEDGPLGVDVNEEDGPLGVDVRRRRDHWE